MKMLERSGKENDRKGFQPVVESSEKSSFRKLEVSNQTQLQIINLPKEKN